ncbi:hypothetical protein BDN67DRAFT_1015920 [Paxillus ammoniavirescens]|nr:hypothetical protein BDN67DRAFT_1015920 [Paxillus ammoniavirescens]
MTPDTRSQLTGNVWHLNGLTGDRIGHDNPEQPSLSSIYTCEREQVKPTLILHDEVPGEIGLDLHGPAHVMASADAGGDAEVTASVSPDDGVGNQHSLRTQYYTTSPSSHPRDHYSPTPTPQLARSSPSCFTGSRTCPFLVHIAHMSARTYLAQHDPVI